MSRPFVPHIITDDTALVAGPYQIERSLRFDRNGSPGLSRTPSSSGNRRKWTFSCWLKPNMIIPMVLLDLYLVMIILEIIVRQ